MAAFSCSLPCDGYGSRLRQVFTNLGQERTWAEGLRDIAVATSLERLDVIPAQLVRGHSDVLDLLERLVSPDPACGLVSVEAGELDIHEDQVGELRFGRLHPFFPGHRFDDLIADTREQVTHDAPVILFVFDDQDPLAHVASLCRSTRTGSVNQKVEPVPRLDSTHMRPPCMSIIFLAMVRPRPVPPFFRVLELSACWNSSKTFCWSTAAIPGPVSDTATINVPFAEVTCTPTSPTSVNLIALPTRLRSTWVIR